MAHTSSSARPRHPARQPGSRGVPSMSERQLDAYFQARDTLRRVRAVASLASQRQRERSPSAAGS